MSKTKAKLEQKEIIQEEQASTENKKDGLKIIHQILIIAAINLLVILMEGFHTFNKEWLSITMFCVLMAGNLVFNWFKQAYLKFLLPLNFVSLAVYGGLLKNPLVVTIVFCVLTIGYFAFSFYKKDELNTILTILFTGLSMFLFTALMIIDHGFIKVNYELNVVSMVWLAWIAAIAALIIVNKEKYIITITGSVISIIFSAIGPFFNPETDNSNTFTLICGLSVLAISIISILMTYSKDNFNFGKFIGSIVIILVGTTIFSYSFAYSFDWLDSVPNASQIKAVLVDYLLFVPLVIFSVSVLILYYHRKNKEKIPEKERLPYIYNKELSKTDGILFGIYMMFLAVSQIMYIDEYKLNIIKALIVSIFFFGASVSFNIRITPIMSIIASLSFFGLLLFVYELLDNDYILIILMAFASVMLIFSVINELFIKGEPLTSTLMISGALVLMVTSIIYFYLQTFDLRYIMPGLVWGVIGLFLFTIGIVFNRIVLRRTGLIIILADILYSLIVVIIQYRGWQMGVSFIVLALVLLGCIYLFRWSEKKETKLKETKEAEAK
ncbi:MAG: hypothetical protein FK734_20565 [Asgard group archaeon]|nr:hypothetical protein [Asgard group archaeon]